MAMAFSSQSDDVSSVQSMEVAEMLRGLSAPYGQGRSNQGRHCSAPALVKKSMEPPAANVGGYETDELDKSSNSVSSWHFDLGPLKQIIKDVENSPLPTNKQAQQAISKAATATTAETLSMGDCDDDEDDDDLSSISQEMLEARMALMNMTRRTFDQSHATFNSSVNHFNNSAPNSPMKNSELLKERRAARAARMEKVRQRIAREREDAKQRKLQEEQRAKELFMSEEARRQRIYEWYCRLGMPNRKELKKKIKSMDGGEQKLTEQDVDLLPWNFNGSLLNISKLHKLGVTAR
ncbi:hypothetical protein ACA910_010603 [Epithemia clementina (nom. ined.)]